MNEAQQAMAKFLSEQQAEDIAELEDDIEALSARCIALEEALELISKYAAEQRSHAQIMQVADGALAKLDEVTPEDSGC